MRQIVVGLGGGTASGKSCLSEWMAKLAHPGELTIVQTDSYYLPLGHLPPDERAQVNFDHPDQIEIELLIKHVAALKNNEKVAIPIYDFAQHDRKVETFEASPTPIVIVEGILALHYPLLREHYHYSIFIEAPAELRRERRSRRDVKERGRSQSSVDAQWINTVAPMHELYCQPSKQYADAVIDGSTFSEQNAASELAKIRSILSKNF